MQTSVAFKQQYRDLLYQMVLLENTQLIRTERCAHLRFGLEYLNHGNIVNRNVLIQYNSDNYKKNMNRYGDARQRTLVMLMVLLLIKTSLLRL